ncbi:MAG TPA: hypothetical protein VMF03_12360 [Steroidobacteraceae bacterium]|nr:hypothetical protein [Steroidobacteraceae bacterium]
MRTMKLPGFAITTLLAIVCATAPAFAHGGGGGHGGGGFHGGGFHGGGFHGGGFHGGGYRGRPGRGGGYYRGGRGGWGGGYYGYGLGWLGYGLTLSALPLFYSTYWWDGVPYYYGDDNYYVWDTDADAYETVEPPAGLAAQVAASPPVQPDTSLELYAYPRNGQSASQQAQDRAECKQWAIGQAGSDPAKHAQYLRAEEACLVGRGYSVR